jgi:hypothetical protein
MDVLRNVPFEVATMRDASGQVCVKVRFYDRDRPADEIVLAFDRDPAVALIEALRVAVEILEADSPASQN